jgi:hypothetical protein
MTRTDRPTEVRVTGTIATNNARVETRMHARTAPRLDRPGARWVERIVVALIFGLPQAWDLSVATVL